MWRAQRSPEILEKQLPGMLENLGHDSPDKERHQMIPAQPGGICCSLHRGSVKGCWGRDAVSLGAALPGTQCLREGRQQKCCWWCLIQRQCQEVDALSLLLSSLCPDSPVSLAGSSQSSAPGPTSSRLTLPPNGTGSRPANTLSPSPTSSMPLATCTGSSAWGAPRWGQHCTASQLALLQPALVMLWC